MHLMAKSAFAMDTKQTVFSACQRFEEAFKLLFSYMRSTYLDKTKLEGNGRAKEIANKNVENVSECV